VNDSMRLYPPEKPFQFIISGQINPEELDIRDIQCMGQKGTKYLPVRFGPLTKVPTQKSARTRNKQSFHVMAPIFMISLIPSHKNY
jgi:hypothetical protein